LKNKLEEVFIKIENHEYSEAINKLLNDVKAKTDGDSITEDWIIFPGAQRQACEIIDELSSFLRGL